MLIAVLICVVFADVVTAACLVLMLLLIDRLKAGATITAALICSALALVVSMVNMVLMLHVIARQNETPTQWPQEWLDD